MNRFAREAELYDKPYFEANYREDARRAAMYKLELARILKWKKSGSVLDVGCGTGAFLELFGNAWDRYGYEPAEYAAHQAHEKGIYLYSQMERVPDLCMDVVIFRGSLQHIYEPMLALFEAERVLKPGGMLVILATPNSESLVYKLWGQLPALDARRNWVVFGRRGLENIVQRLGLRLLAVEYPYWETPYASPLADFGKFALSLLFGWRKFAFPGSMMEIYAIKQESI